MSKRESAGSGLNESFGGLVWGDFLSDWSGESGEGPLSTSAVNIVEGETHSFTFGEQELFFVLLCSPSVSGDSPDSSLSLSLPDTPPRFDGSVSGHSPDIVRSLSGDCPDTIFLFLREYSSLYFNRFGHSMVTCFSVIFARNVGWFSER